MTDLAVASAEPLRYRSARGRWALAAVVLGSGAAFLEGSVVSVALPAIGRDLDLRLGGLQWILNAYLIALSALIVLGGSLGDQFGRRRVFVIGAIGFSVTSILCALAPSLEVLVVARVLQGAAGAMMVPGSLAIVEASFAEEDRGQAIGAWAGGRAYRPPLALSPAGRLWTRAHGASCSSSWWWSQALVPSSPLVTSPSRGTTRPPDGRTGPVPYA